MVLDNICRENYHWGLVMTPDARTSPAQDELLAANALAENPRGPLIVTEQPLADIGR
jgi:hypothetical protein